MDLEVLQAQINYTLAIQSVEKERREKLCKDINTDDLIAELKTRLGTRVLAECSWCDKIFSISEYTRLTDPTETICKTCHEELHLTAIEETDKP